MLFLLLLLPKQEFARGEPIVAYDEILLYMNVQGVGGMQVQAAIFHEVAWLSITDIFDFIKIKNTPSAGLDSISGFFILRQSTFLIDAIHNQITYQGKVLHLPEEALIHSSTNLYLRANYFGQIFGLECKFNFRNLSIILTSKQELPVVRELRQEAMRSNLSNLRGDTKADTNYKAVRPPFHFGMTDWAVVATQNPASDQYDSAGQLSSQPRNNVRLNLALGGVVAGGETNVSLNYDNRIPFAERQQYYQWRHVDNDHPGLRQVTAGKFYTPSISSVYSPFVGIQFTNAPTTYRRAFGTYTLTYFAELDWVVELYVNNELIDYARAAVTGTFTFQVPLVYGNTVVKLRYYSPWGEERSTEQNIQVPFTFLPAHEFEYTATAGMIEDSVNSRLSRANFNYGLSQRLTLGAGIEYRSSISTGKFIPFVNASYRIVSNLLIAGEYDYGVRGKLVTSYSTAAGLQFELDYTRYKQGQKAIYYTYREERKATVSYPFRSKKFTVFTRLSVYQILLAPTKFTSSKYTTAQGLLSGTFLGINTNITTFALFIQQADTYVYSNISMAFRFPKNIIFTPQAQYEYNRQKFIGIKEELGKYIGSRGYFNVFYENNFKSGIRNIGIGLRYDLSAALTGLSVIHGNHNNSIVESASGSILYDARTRYTGFSNHSSVGRGVLIVVPFLDLNDNGRRDPDEPKVYGLSMRMNGGRIRNNKADTTIQISDLEAYSNYMIRFEGNFENIAWRLRYKKIRVMVDPNQFKTLEIPVSIVGEVSGSVFRKDEEEELQPQDRVIVCFYRSDATLAGQTTTEGDGSFDFSGLAPGTYTARINEDQLKKLNWISLSRSLPFIIRPNSNGDVVEGLKFVLEPAAVKSRP